MREITTTTTLAAAPTLETCLAGIRAQSGHALRGILGMGQHLVQAQAIFTLPAGQRGQGRKSSATVALDSGNEGFDQWMAENVLPLGISRRTAYNYMAAAGRMGLGPGSTDADLAALDLVGRKATDLYKLDGPKGTPEKAPQISAQAAACQLWLPLWDQLADAASPTAPTATALWHLPLVSADPTQPSLAGMETKLRGSLDLIKEIRAARAAK